MTLPFSVTPQLLYDDTRNTYWKHIDDLAPMMHRSSNSTNLKTRLPTHPRTNSQSIPLLPNTEEGKGQSENNTEQPNVHTGNTGSHVLAGRHSDVALVPDIPHLPPVLAHVPKRRIATPTSSPSLSLSSPSMPPPANFDGLQLARMRQDRRTHSVAVPQPVRRPFPIPARPHKFSESQS